MKKEYWILYNGKEVVQDHEKNYEVGSIHFSFCPQGICNTSGAYIVFDEKSKTYKQDLLTYLILREEIAIKKHSQDKNMYADLLSKVSNDCVSTK